MISAEIINNLAPTDITALAEYANSAQGTRLTLPTGIFLPRTNTELNDMGWTKMFNGSRTKYFHPILNVETNEDATRFYKFALLDKMYSVVDDKTFSNLVYVSDKWGKIRGVESEVMEPISVFKVFAELKKSTGKYTLRHNGTQEGCELLNSANVKSNFEYLLLLQFGPSHTQLFLKCSLLGHTLDGIGVTNFESNTKTIQYTHQIHHSLYDSTGSVHKSKEPSKIMGSRNYRMFTHEEHMELLGCIIMSGDAHDAIHNSNRKDGIDNWAKRFISNECHFLPFHWVSERNYTKTIKFLDDHTTYFDKNKAPTYKDFIAMNSTPYLTSVALQRSRNNFSQLFGLSL
jgi:hypothetical protein